MSEAELHRHVAELVPWYVNGTLEGRDRDAVTTHLPGCPACREEVARCQTLAAAIQSAVDAAGAPGPGRLERVLASIDLLEAMGARRTGWRGRWRAGVEWLGDLFQRTPGPVRWGLVAQAAVLVLVVGLVAWPGVRSPRAPYRTLADGGEQRVGREALIHVVFTEDITERELRTLLGRVEGRIVDGPSAVGLYTVGVRASTPDRAVPIIEILRGDPKVRLAEPVPSR
jgi:anti-sigma factor RsiW